MALFNREFVKLLGKIPQATYEPKFELGSLFECQALHEIISKLTLDHFKVQVITLIMFNLV